MSWKDYNTSSLQHALLGQEPDLIWEGKEESLEMSTFCILEFWQPDGELFFFLALILTVPPRPVSRKRKKGAFLQPEVFERGNQENKYLYSYCHLQSFLKMASGEIPWGFQKAWKGITSAAAVPDLPDSGGAKVEARDEPEVLLIDHEKKTC